MLLPEHYPDSTHTCAHNPSFPIFFMLPFYVPLCLQLRARLKKAHPEVDADTVECVYSSEEQVTEMLPLSKEQKKNPEEFGVVDNFRYALGCTYAHDTGVHLGHASKHRVVCFIRMGI